MDTPRLFHGSHPQLTQAVRPDLLIVQAVLFLVSLSLSSLASAQTSPLPDVVESGDGWQRVTETAPNDPNFLTLSSTTSPVREVIVVSSADGLEDSPLPKAVKDMLRPDFDPAGTESETVPHGEAVVVDVAVAEAIARGTAEEEYGAFLEPDAEGEVNSEGWGCHTRWRYREWDAYSLDFDQSRVLREQRRVSLHAGLQLDGRATAYVGYKYKKTRFCLPWVAWFTHVRVDGRANFSGSNLNVGGSITDARWEERWRREFGRLFDFSRTFLVGPVPVRVGLQMPYGLGLDVALDLAANVHMDLPISGSIWFNYTCDFGGCHETPNGGGSGSRFEIGNGGDIELDAPGVGVSANLDLLLRPFAYIELLGYFYHPSVASAGFGIEAGLPIRRGAYGGRCGDANGDGTAEGVDTEYTDVNAELALYFTYNLAGLSEHFGMDWGLSVDLLGRWRLYELTHDDDAFRGSSRLLTLRRNLYFSYDPDDSVGDNIFSPMIFGEPSPIVGVSSDLILDRRLCNPFKDAMTYEVRWPDGSIEEVSDEESSSTGHRTAPAIVSRTWDSLETSHVTVSPVRDSAGREYQHATDGTRFRVQPVADVPPPKPETVSVPAQRNPCSTCRATVSWNRTAITERYEVQVQENGGVWRSHATVTDPTSSTTFLARRVGNYRFKVKSCNNFGCSPWTTSGNLQVGNPPSRPSLTVRSERCYGMNQVSWTAVSGATRYELWRSSSSRWTSPVRVQSGTSRSFFSNTSNTVWYRVKACNTVGCSSLSTARAASYHRGCF